MSEGAKSENASAVDPSKVAAPLAWARAHRDPSEASRTRMELMPPGKSPGTLETPFPKVPKEEYRAMVRGQGIAKKAAEAPIGRVRLRDIVTPQRGLNQERLAQHLADPDLVPKGSRASGSGMPNDLPVVVKKGGKYFVHDGNHRLTAAKLRGEERAKARIVDLDGDGP